MASFSFTVDTDPMAREISHVSRRVDLTTGAVVAMKAAVVSAEHEAANKICGHVNKGFFSMMQAQITQKIAHCTSAVESKLFELQQENISLQAIKNRMTRDYNMISNRYNKLFNSLNAALKTRIYELDKPALELATKDMALKDNRFNAVAALFSTNQSESVLGSQHIALSKTKRDCSQAISAIGQYLDEMHVQADHFESAITDKTIEETEDVLLPVVFCETTTATGGNAVNTQLPKTGMEQVDRNISNSVNSQVMTTMLDDGAWGSFDNTEMKEIEIAFTGLLGDVSDTRVSTLIQSMFDASKAMKQPKKA